MKITEMSLKYVQITLNKKDIGNMMEKIYILGKVDTKKNDWTYL